MTHRNPRNAALLALAVATSLPAVAQATQLKICIVQAQAGDARKHQPLLEYLGSKGVSASFVTAPDYRSAADMFAKGEVDAMFGGSGISGTMMIKGLAAPLVSALGPTGPSTYHAVVIAPKGSPKFTGDAAYFHGKRVIFSALASAGEFFLYSTGKPKPTAALRAASHGAALDALSRGQADVAIVKNHVWNKERSKYPGYEEVGADSGENPDGSLIVSKRMTPADAAKVKAALIELKGDASAPAAAAKSSLGISGYAPVTEKEFAHTLALLEKAGVGPGFAFAF